RIGLLNDTWMWDGASWMPYPITGVVSPPFVPPRRMDFAVTSQEGMAIFGGSDPDGAAQADMLGLFDTWNRRSISGPQARTQSAMSVGVGFATILFGGQPASGPALDDTWRLTDGAWARITPAHVPAPRQNHTMVYDATRLRLVMFGGQ